MIGMQRMNVRQRMVFTTEVPKREWRVGGLADRASGRCLSSRWGDYVWFCALSWLNKEVE